MKAIEEINGVPSSYMELYDGFSFVRFVYRTVRWKFATKEEAEAFLERLMAEVKFYLPEYGTIIWREKPGVHANMTGYMMYTRFATSPPLPEAFWQTYQVSEGAETPDWKSCHIPRLLWKRTEGV